MKASLCISFLFCLLFLGCAKARIPAPLVSKMNGDWLIEGPRFVGSNEFLRDFESLASVGPLYQRTYAVEDAGGRIRLDEESVKSHTFLGREMWSSWVAFQASRNVQIDEPGIYEIFTQKVTALWIDEQLFLAEPFLNERPIAEIILSAGPHKIRIQVQGLWPSDFQFSIRKKVFSKPIFKDELLKTLGARREFYKSKWDSVDGHYAVLEPIAFSSKASESKKYALIVALHGAHVEDLEHLKTFKQKDWAFVLAPSNRGPQGLGWNDLASLDALDVIDKVVQKYPIDPDRIYLSGHSMGAQGALHLALLSPDRFAAVSLQAPWIEPETYLMAPFSLSNLILNPEARSLRDRLSGNYRHTHRLDGLSTLPILISTAEFDPVVSPLHSRWLENELRMRNIEVTKVEHLRESEHWCRGPESIQRGFLCTDFAEQDEFFKSKKNKRHDRFVIETYDPALHAGAFGVRILSQEKVQNESRLWVDCEKEKSCRLRSINVRSLEWSRPWPKQILWNDKPVLVKNAGANKILALKKIDLSTASIRGSWVSFFASPITLLIADESSQRVAAVIKRQIERYSGQVANILKVEQASVSRLENSNIMLVGLSETAFLKDQIWNRLPFEFSSKQISILDRTLSFKKAYGIWMLRPSPWNSQRLLAIASASDAERLDDLLRWLRPLTRLGQGLSDFLIFDESLASREWGAVRAAGFFSPTWDLSSKDTFFFEERDSK